MVTKGQPELQARPVLLGLKEQLAQPEEPAPLVYKAQQVLKGVRVRVVHKVQ